MKLSKEDVIKITNKVTVGYNINVAELERRLKIPNKVLAMAINPNQDRGLPKKYCDGLVDMLSVLDGKNKIISNMLSEEREEKKPTNLIVDNDKIFDHLTQEEKENKLFWLNEIKRVKAN